ncbi:MULTISPECIES: hypothetical protein [unclassified Acinetobacter]|uniref:hypothetical protein n=1 Tax=unclassified Acinetobacter TaxID=196816 RepID=UPI0035BAC0BB
MIYDIQQLDDNHLYQILNSATIVAVETINQNIFIKCEMANDGETPFTIILNHVQSILENQVAQDNFGIQYDDGEIIKYSLENHKFTLLIL